jgi:hypothetical protein
MRVAFATLAVLATTAFGMFIDGLARSSAPERQFPVDEADRRCDDARRPLIHTLPRNFIGR